jgi:glyoxylate reductase
MNRMEILVTARLPKEVLSRLAQEHQVEAYDEDRPMERPRLLQSVADKEGLLCTITDRIDEELLDHAPALKVIANYGVGFEHIDLEAATRRGIPVTNTPGVLTDSTADLTLALILAVARRVVEGDRRVREGKFQYWAPLHFQGQEVSGKTLGIIGLGRIGQAVARRAAGFGMRLIYHSRRRLQPSQEQELKVSYEPLETLLRDADFITLHVPLAPQTRHLIGSREFQLMKPSAYLINTARGPVVDEASLDVYEREPELSPGLSDLENVILLPHVGSATIETRTRMAVMAAENLLAGLRGEQPPNCLNWEPISR